MTSDDIRLITLKCAKALGGTDGLSIETDLTRANIIPEQGWSDGFRFIYQKDVADCHVSDGLLHYSGDCAAKDSDGAEVDIYLYKDADGVLSIVRFVRWDNKPVLALLPDSVVQIATKHIV
jgi:hypothetical protein